MDDRCGYGWRSVWELANLYCCLDERNVQRHIKALEQEGWIRVERGTGRQRSRYWYLFKTEALDFGGDASVTPQKGEVSSASPQGWKDDHLRGGADDTSEVALTTPLSKEMGRGFKEDLNAGQFSTSSSRRGKGEKSEQGRMTLLAVEQGLGLENQPIETRVRNLLHLGMSDERICERLGDPGLQEIIESIRAEAG